MKKPGKEVKPFIGRPIDQIPILLEQGYEPLSVAEAMEWRLWALEQSPEIRSAWWDQPINCGGTTALSRCRNSSSKKYFDTADTYLDMKFVSRSPTIRNLSPESELHQGGLKLTNEQYDSQEALETSVHMSSTYTLSNNFLFHLAEGKQTLLDNYLEAVKEFYPEQLPGRIDDSPVYITPMAKLYTPTERITTLNRMKKDYSRIHFNTNLAHTHLLIGMKRE